MWSTGFHIRLQIQHLPCASATAGYPGQSSLSDTLFSSHGFYTLMGKYQHSLVCSMHIHFIYLPRKVFLWFFLFQLLFILLIYNFQVFSSKFLYKLFYLRQKKMLWQLIKLKMAETKLLKGVKISNFTLKINIIKINSP